MIRLEDFVFLIKVGKEWYLGKSKLGIGHGSTKQDFRTQPGKSTRGNSHHDSHWVRSSIMIVKKIVWIEEILILTILIMNHDRGTARVALFSAVALIGWAFVPDNPHAVIGGAQSRQSDILLLYCLYHTYRWIYILACLRGMILSMYIHQLYQCLFFWKVTQSRREFCSFV